MKRSKFSLSNTKLLSMNMGQLVPIGLTEVLPGDSFQQSTQALVRVAPLVSPVMHPVEVRIHHWFVPHRLVWDSWEDFITGGPDGMDASVFPTMTFAGGIAIGTLGDYLGIPPGVPGIEVSALPYRGYALIFNEFYRDQDLQTLLGLGTGDGDDPTTNVILQNVCWEKDYFTSSRPWTQKGPDVSLPLGSTAPVVYNNNSSLPNLIRNFDGTITGNGNMTIAGGAGAMTNSAAPNNPLILDPNGRLHADLSAATAASVNDLRQALAIQRYEEARARYGSRYTEYLRYLGVRSSDARLQRPEYLGGGKQVLQFSEVLQTATGGGGVGSLFGHGIGSARSNRFRRFFEEHGFVFTLMSVRPKTIYGNGLYRHWNRRTKEDFFQKELQHIGQQEVLNKELYAGAASPNGIFGYQDRYDEYRRSESTIAGEFRDTLDFWHYARIFGSEPALNAAFVSAADVTNRVYAAPSANQLYVHARHSIQARRLVDGSATPSIL